MMKDNVKKAFAIANNAIYFDDNSDYYTALYEIAELLNLNGEDIGDRYIEEE